jgi:ubiquinone/menaquinone biosynthesis C-methylase UbiE
MNGYEKYPGVDSLGPIGIVSRIEHKALERNPHFSERILEIGGGKGDHLRFRESESYQSYDCLDLFKPVSTDFPSNVQFHVGDVQGMFFQDDTFDLTIMTCVLHHLRDPESALKEMLRVTKSGGEIRILLAHDPGFLYRAGWKLFGPRNRLKWDSTNPKYAHAVSHLLSGLSLHEIIMHTYSNFKITRWGTILRKPYWHLNLSSVYSVRIEK